MVKQNYCPYCKDNRQLKMPKFSWTIWILTTIFTMFWGFWIYPLIHFSQSPSRCIECGAKIGNWFNGGPLFNKDGSEKTFGESFKEGTLAYKMKYKN